MVTRKIQQTKDMKYIYLPTKWCRDNKIEGGDEVQLKTNDQGNLVLSKEKKISKGKHVKINIDSPNQDYVLKTIIACYISGAQSFEINTKKVSIPKLLETKNIVSLDLIDVYENKIISESSTSIDDPIKALINMVKKIKNIIVLYNNNSQIQTINYCEAEIDRTNLLLEKYTIGALTNSINSKLRPIEIHFISKISRILENIADNVLEKKYCESTTSILNEVIKTLETLNENNLINIIELQSKLKHNFSLFDELSNILTDWVTIINQPKYSI